jgi:hypothetical protein
MDQVDLDEREWEIGGQSTLLDYSVGGHAGWREERNQIDQKPKLPGRVASGGSTREDIHDPLDSPLIRLD